MSNPENEQVIRDMNKRFSEAAPEEVLSYLLKEYGSELAFSSSLGAEDQVITHMLAGMDKQARIFTLDTGRLFPETLDLLDNTNKRYDISIKVYFPDAARVEDMVNRKGINLFYESIKNRKECCHIRKILPMKRALKGAKVWVSGLRSEQSVTRKDLALAEWDNNFSLIKISPLRSWNEKQVWDFIESNNIPYNKLHDRGFPSIGCQPCTRAIEPGEDIRAGRWWWELPEMKECGLHTKKKS
ncbi:MAG: phosphoadenylyl-sulfate reductase [Bacteroidales bacterium]|nr:phosphoadenylyl-sulfate reductase [Bacteroidales bacterium]